MNKQVTLDRCETGWFYLTLLINNVISNDVLKGAYVFLDAILTTHFSLNDHFKHCM